ncbi:MAG: phosphopantetheine-binding protein [Acidimicrobiales bacterium]|nr:acyl carrier protein [Acidimicrobiales bacterium]
MTPLQLQAELCALINDELSLDPDVEVASDTDLLETEALDSLGVVQIVDWLSDRLGVEVPPSEVTVDNFGTVARMVDLATRLQR